MNSVQFCSAAETDFTEALRYYATRNPEFALQFDAEVDSALRRIAAGAEQFPAVDHGHRYLTIAPVSIFDHFSGHQRQDHRHCCRTLIAFARLLAWTLMQMT